MSRRRGIIYGTFPLLRRVWAHRQGRLLLIGLLLIAGPIVLERAIFLPIGLLPGPTRGRIWNAIWPHTDWYQVPILVTVGSGILLVGFVCLRMAVRWILTTPGRE